MIVTVDGPAPNYKKTKLWAMAFFAGMFGVPLIGGLAKLPQYIIMTGMALSMLLLIPMVRSSMKENAKHGLASPALHAYNRRTLIWSFGYMAALFFSLWVYNSFKPAGLLLWVIAILPSIPIFYFIWTMGQYFREEADEYIRMKNISAAMFATGLLLAAATLWGFLETFEIVPHVPGWMAVPVWAIGLALGQFSGKLRGI